MDAVAERPWRRAVDAALTRPSAAWAMAALYALVGLIAVASNAFLSDEGMLAWFMARAVGDEPAATVFLLKSRPALSLLYAPVAAGGYTAYLVAHVIVAALAVPLAASIARAFDQRWPNLAALLIAASPLLLAGGAAGINNTDAVTGALLVVWLLAVRGNALVAGLVLGALVFARYEMALFAAVFGGYALIARRHWRFAAGAAVVPVLLWLGGAIYHGDVLWPLSFPPALPGADSPMFAAHGYGATLGETADALLALTPAIGLAALLRARRLTGYERVLAVFAGVYLLVIRGLPFLGWFNFDATPRYAIPLLPFAALIAGRVVGDWMDDGARNPLAPVWLLVLLVAAHFADVEGAPALMLGVVGWSGVVVVARAGAPRVAAASVAVLAVAAAPPLLGATRLEVHQQVRGLRPLAAWVAAERPPVVITNMHLLATWLDRSGEVDGVEVMYVVQRDQWSELDRLTNAEVGQDAAIRRALRGGFYGEPVFPGELRLEMLPDGAVVAVDTDDPRLDEWLPPETWDGTLETAAGGTGWRVGRVAREAP